MKPYTPPEIVIMPFHTDDVLLFSNPDESGFIPRYRLEPGEETKIIFD